MVPLPIVEHAEADERWASAVSTVSVTRGLSKAAEEVCRLLDRETGQTLEGAINEEWSRSEHDEHCVEGAP